MTNAARVGQSFFAIVIACLPLGLPLEAAILTNDLSLYYRADNVDGLGNPGDASTSTLVNLANPGTFDGTLVSHATVISNPGAPLPHRYGVRVFAPSATPDYISAGNFRVNGGANALNATFEYWMRVEGTGDNNRAALYTEANTFNQSRHQIRLELLDADSGPTDRGVYFSSPRSNTATAPAVTSDSGLASMGEFAQIAVVFSENGTKLQYYRNGQPFGDEIAMTPHTYSGSALTDARIGWAALSGADAQFNIMRIYDRALSSEEIFQNFQAEQAVPEPSAVVLVLFGLLLLGGKWYRRTRN